MAVLFQTSALSLSSFWVSTKSIFLLFNKNRAVKIRISWNPGQHSPTASKINASTFLVSTTCKKSLWSAFRLHNVKMKIISWELVSGSGLQRVMLDNRKILGIESYNILQACYIWNFCIHIIPLWVTAILLNQMAFKYKLHFMNYENLHFISFSKPQLRNW